VGKNNWRRFLVKSANQADEKIFFVDYENQADFKIYFVKYENQAGVKRADKKAKV
jgi:hypothetical protein